MPPKLKGTLFVALAFLCMAIFGVFMKLDASGEPLIVSFSVYLASTLFLVPFMVFKGVNFLKTDHFWLHFGRAAFGVTASFLYMLSLNSISLVNATLLFNTAPIFIPILSILLLKAKISKLTWGAIFLGFIGIICIIKPGVSLFKDGGNLIALGSGISLAVAYLLIKLLTPTDPPLRIVFYFFFLATLLQIPFLFFTHGSITTSELGIALLAAMAFVLAQLFLVEGYKYAEPSQAGVFQYTTVVYVGLIDWWIWGIVPTSIDLVGLILVALAGSLIIFKGVSKTA